MPRGDRGGSSRGSGTRCVAANCGNTNADGFSLHSFPKDPNLRRKWTGFVKLKRANWDGPTEFSALCSVHFIIDDFPFRHRFEIEHMGRAPKKAKLNVGAVPTVHSPSIAKQVSMVKEKPLETEQPIPTTPKHTLPRLEMLSPSETSTCQSSPPKKIRRGYIKREAARLVADHYQNISTVSEPAEEDKQETSVSEPAEDIDQPDNHVMDFEEVVEYEVDDPKPTTASFSCQVNKRPKKRSKYCQTNSKTTKYQKPAVKMRTIGTQTDGTNEIQPPKPLMSDAFQLVRPDNLKPLTMPRKSKEHARSSTTTIDEPFSSPMKDDQESDPSYQPLSPSSDDNDEQEMRNMHVPVEEDSKFIVFQSHLMELFTTCTKCMADTVGEIMYTRGSMVKIKQECKICLYVRFWFSQPFVGNKPAGNLSISAGILFSGSVPSKALRMLKFMNICGISMSSYMNHQKFYLYPAIGHVWHNYQNDYANDIQQQQRSVTLGGDGRADTPGHSAKFGSYTMLDLHEGVVVDIQLVQSNEVKSSCHMEKEGLQRSVEFFKHHNINIKTLVTDRHVQIKKWVRENMEDTTHAFDVWHVAKGMKKKLFALSKEKDCSDVSPWIKSMVNHMYWTAASSANLNEDLILAKWQSISNHIINIHDGHSTLFPSCQHDDLEGRERHKKWLKPGSKVYEKLQDIVNSRQMKKDIPMLSSGQQTSELEGFHSVVNHFAPKMIGFSFHGMLSRQWLAAMHFNENSNRDHALTQDGKARYRIVYPKYKKGEHTVRKIPVDPTFEYVESLMKTVFNIAKVSHMNKEGIQLLVDVPPPLCSQYERPDKEEAIQSLLARFNRCQPHENQCSSGADQGRQSGS